MNIPARLDEAHGVEGDLPDETVVGYHHGHGAEQSLGVEGDVSGSGWGVEQGRSRQRSTPTSDAGGG